VNFNLWLDFSFIIQNLEIRNLEEYMLKNETSNDEDIIRKSEICQKYIQKVIILSNFIFIIKD
jgi:hypothetical protein